MKKKEKTLLYEMVADMRVLVNNPSFMDRSVIEHKWKMAFELEDIIWGPSSATTPELIKSLTGK